MAKMDGFLNNKLTHPYKLGLEHMTLWLEKMYPTTTPKWDAQKYHHSFNRFLYSM